VSFNLPMISRSRCNASWHAERERNEGSMAGNSDDRKQICSLDAAGLLREFAAKVSCRTSTTFWRRIAIGCACRPFRLTYNFPTRAPTVRGRIYASVVIFKNCLVPEPNNDLVETVVNSPARGNRACLHPFIAGCFSYWIVVAMCLMGEL
jgi:hypothetical protein